jgi:hypothetical protein
MLHRPAIDLPLSPALKWRSLAAVVVVAFGWMAALVAGVPGHFSVDSVTQLAQGRTGLYDDWHPPLMAWLLGLADRVTPGGDLFVIADVTVFFLAMLGFALSEGVPRVRAIAVLALVAASPQALVFQGVVWKDVLFADATLAAFAALAMSGAPAGQGTRRVVWLGIGFAGCVVAALARQTGFVVPLAAAGVFLVLELGARRSPAASFGKAIAGLAACAVIAGLAHAAFAAHSNGKRGAEAQLAMLRTFDLAGAARLDPGLPLRALHVRAPALERFERRLASPAWRAGSIDVLDALPGAPALLPPRTPALAADWRSLILRRPWLYARVRARVFWDTLATPDSADCPLVSVGVQTGDAPELARAGLRRRLTSRDQWDEDYVWAFWDTPALSHLAWGVLALALLVLDARDVARGDRRPGVLAAIGLLVAALAYAGTYFVASVACDYRYLYLLDVAAMAALAQRAGAAAYRPQAARPTTAVARRSSLPQPTR